MRSTLSTLLFFLIVFLFPGAEAREPTQHRIARRTPSPILDTCAYIDAPLSDIINSISGTNSSTANEENILVEQCVCTSMVRLVLDSSHLGNVNVDMNGIVHAFEAHIAENYNAKHCVYPPHSVARCSRDDLCGFECSSGFKHASFSVRGRQADACTCPPPNTVCDGQCGPFPEGCPSTTTTSEDTPASYRNTAIRLRPSPYLHPSPRPSAAFQSHAATPTGSFSNAMAQEAQDAGCAPHETRCGAYAPRGRRAVECVDTQRSLESCGGCMLPPPSPFYALDAENAKREETIGVDCSALEGVADVGCRTGRCVVQACQAGWAVAPSGEHCVPNPFDNAAHPRPGDGAFDSARFVPSRMPLLRPSPSMTTGTTSSNPPMASSTDPPQNPNANADDSGSSSDPPSDSDDSDSSDPSSSPSSARFSSARTGVDPASDPDAGTGADSADTDLSFGGSTGLPSFGRLPAAVDGDDGLPEDITGLGIDDPRPGLGLRLAGALGAGPSDVNDVLPLDHFGNLLRPFTEDPTNGNGDGEDPTDPSAFKGFDFAVGDYGAPGAINPSITIDLDLAEALGDGADIDARGGLPPPPGGGPQPGSIAGPSVGLVGLVTGASSDGTDADSHPTVSSAGARLDFGRVFGAVPDPDAENYPEETPPDGNNDPIGPSVTAETDALSTNGDIVAADAIGYLSQNNAAPSQIQGPSLSDGAENPGLAGDVNGSDSANFDTATGAVDAANSGLSGMEAGAETGAEDSIATLATAVPADNLMDTASNGSGVAVDAETAVVGGTSGRTTILRLV